MISDAQRGKPHALTADDPKPLLEGERALLFAILFTAMQDAKGSGRQRRRAIEYLLNEDEDYLFSFRSICDYLNVDPHKALQLSGLRAGKKQ